MPGPGTDKEPHSMEEGNTTASTARKRKIAGTNEEKIRRLDEELELVRISMEKLRMEIKVDFR